MFSLQIRLHIRGAFLLTGENFRHAERYAKDKRGDDDLGSIVRTRSIWIRQDRKMRTIPQKSDMGPPAAIEDPKFTSLYAN